MDPVTLKKKLSTYLSPKGQLRNVSPEVLYELLVAWENWSGSSIEFYRSVGFSQWQMASVLGKAKKLKREGHFGEPEFKQVKLEGLPPEISPAQPCSHLEVVLADGKIIRFGQVDLLIDFLRKVA